MRTIKVFNNITLDGFFTDRNNDMSVFHRGSDPEWNKFTSQNASARGGTTVFGRKTYEMMKSFWPTEQAKQAMPEVAAGMEAMDKVVFSRTLTDPGWKNARVIRGDLAAEVRRMKNDTGGPILIMGSGSIVSQLTKERLIDNYTMVIWPIILGAGRTMFEGVEGAIDLVKLNERAFANGNLVVSYELRR